ncbi:hypothetical protein HPB50_015042 [Hyalomma asiaticum]|uniref:Uncharacterized protein n=1 Tax=Hyalomma asiaticum TaxID=266040 RepID=A0ACB7SUB4_HYAAI|nr:hypothetical protein HPB50_015042 [Hyalomma asiaticum]
MLPLLRQAFCRDFAAIHFSHTINMIGCSETGRRCLLSLENCGKPRPPSISRALSTRASVDAAYSMFRRTDTLALSAAPIAAPPEHWRAEGSCRLMKKKVAIIKQVQSGRSQAKVGREFRVPIIEDFKKNKTEILKLVAKSTKAGKKSAGQGVYVELREALLLWLNAMMSKNIPVSGSILKQMADVFVLHMNMHGFKFSDGWLRNFKNRNDLTFKKIDVRR